MASLNPKSLHPKSCTRIGRYNAMFLGTLVTLGIDYDAHSFRFLTSSGQSTRILRRLVDPSILVLVTATAQFLQTPYVAKIKS